MRDVSIPPFESALRTFLLRARFSFLIEDLDCVEVDALDSVDVVVGSLLWDHALNEAVRINTTPANLIVLFAFITLSPVSMLHRRPIRDGIFEPNAARNRASGVDRVADPCTARGVDLKRANAYSQQPFR
jgi:hypothetical protein